MTTLARASLLLVIVLVSLSAYLRLEHSGIGCSPWPDCYGNIGVQVANPDLSSTYERLLEDARAPLSWATPAHRLVASVLGILILTMALLSLFKRESRLPALALLGLTVFLSWLGIYSEGLHSPAIVMGNLSGGFAMLAILGVLALPRSNRPRFASGSLRTLSKIAFTLLVAQILLGGLTSANFAASACMTLPDCHGSWLPGREIGTAFDVFRQHTMGSTGMVLGGAERADIHKLHRLTAIIVTAVIAWTGILAYRRGGSLRASAIVVLLLVMFEFGLGVSAILTALPIGIAVAHNWIAALLLLAILKLAIDSHAGSG